MTDSPHRDSPVELVVLIPIHNDWEAVALLLDELGDVLPVPALVALIDDGSTLEPEPETLQARGQVSSVRRVRLRRNVGHQRAIAIGLVHVHEHYPGLDCVVIDGDGEDNPADIRVMRQLATASDQPQVVFGARTRRSERWWFQVGYHSYRWLHRLLTGLPVRVGNFSYVPSSCLQRLVVVSEMWNHYAAALIKSRIPYDSVPSARRPRLKGHSSMNLVGLITHGLSAISVYGETVGVRLLVATTLLGALVLGSQGAALIADFESLQSDPAPFLQTLTLLFVGVLQTLVIVALFVFVILAGRQDPAFLPLRDAPFFVLDDTSLSD